MSLTDDVMRQKFVNNRVPAKNRGKFIQAVQQWDVQNPAYAGTYDERVLGALLTFVQKGEIIPPNLGSAFSTPPDMSVLGARPGVSNGAVPSDKPFGTKNKDLK
jgi:hypothetical protein